MGSIIQNTGPFFLGGDPWRPAGGFDGYVDEFKFHNRALTTDEIGASVPLPLPLTLFPSPSLTQAQAQTQT